MQSIPTPKHESGPTPRAETIRDARLRRHADYQRVYAASRKQFSASMTYFYALRTQPAGIGPRVGITAGRVLGKAVERNRIKRRMRECIRRHLELLPGKVDVVLHPRRTVLALEFAALSAEVARVFTQIAAGVERGPAAAAGAKSAPAGPGAPCRTGARPQRQQTAQTPPNRPAAARPPAREGRR
jgi:ribonuclease P protein component